MSPLLPEDWICRDAFLIFHLYRGTLVQYDPVGERGVVVWGKLPAT